MLVWLAGVFLLCFSYFWHFEGDWNTHGRLDTLIALVNQGTFAIDDYGLNTGDVARAHNHIYSNKAPGLTFLGLPVMAAEKVTLILLGQRQTIDNMGLDQPPGPRHRATTDFLDSMNLLAFITVTIPATLFMLLFYWFLGYYSSSVRHRVAVTLLLGLSTIVFPYARLLISHIPTAAMLFAAFVLIYSAKGDDGRGWARRHPDAASALAGLCLGGAILFEYNAALVSAVIGVYGLISLKPRQIVLLVVGGIPPLLAVLGYNSVVYHSPFDTGYSNGLQHPDLQHQGIAGFTLPPRLSAIWGMSLSPYRGMFFLSPWLLAGIPGFALWWRRERRECAVAVAAIVIYFLAITCFFGWRGGDAVGPRYLMPLVPFLALPVVFVLDAVTLPIVRLGIYFLGWCSVVSIWAETTGGTNIEYPGPMHGDPLLQFSWHALLAGRITPSIGSSLLTLLPPTPAALALVPLALFLGIWSLAVYGWYRAGSRSVGTGVAVMIPGGGNRTVSR